MNRDLINLKTFTRKKTDLIINTSSLITKIKNILTNMNHVKDNKDIKILILNQDLDLDQDQDLHPNLNI
jgi:hypothetical protein